MPLKSPVLGTDRSRVSLPPFFYLLMKAQNVMDAKNILSLFAFLKSFNVQVAN